MLTSISQINEQFFKVFHGVKVKVGNKTISVPARYAKKSSKDYSEEQPNQSYPCISIQDYTPKLKREWYVDMRQYVGGLSSDSLTAFLYSNPLWMEFRYDVSVAAKSYNEFMAIKDYFLGNYVCGLRFLFNQKLSGEDAVGDVVPYTLRETDIPRNDGVMETNYEFTLSAWVYPREPKEVEIVENIVVNLIPKNVQ